MLFYLYIFFILCYSSLFAKLPSLVEVFSALTFTWNYVYETSYWLFGHSWSLSVEEQFYMTWPFAIALLTFTRSKKVAFLLILISPVLRVGTYYLFPEWRGRISIMLHTRFDSLMFGCLLSYYFDEGFFDRFLVTIKKYFLHYISLLLILCLSPFLRLTFRGAYGITVGYSLESLAVIILMICAMKLKKEEISYKILNSKLMCHLGILSYGLYLWQQFFLSRHIDYKYDGLRFILLYITVIVIYMFFEYPIGLLSKRIQRKIKV